MTPEREELFKRVIEQRQLDLCVILENVHDPHNIGAVLRSCDSVGVQEVFVIQSDPRFNPEKLEMGFVSSMGARKWVDVRYFTEIDACFAEVRTRYDRILGTRIEPPAENLYELDLTESVALLFGNEHDGVSAEASAGVDGHFYIPQVGMVSSLNISVACAVSLYEAYRQRVAAGRYRENPTMPADRRQKWMDNFKRRHMEHLVRRKAHKKKNNA